MQLFVLVLAILFLSHFVHVSDVGAALASFSNQADTAHIVALQVNSTYRWTRMPASLVFLLTTKLYDAPARMCSSFLSCIRPTDMECNLISFVGNDFHIIGQTHRSRFGPSFLLLPKLAERRRCYHCSVDLSCSNDRLFSLQVASTASAGHEY
jgi:hypothetical protein